MFNNISAATVLNVEMSRNVLNWDHVFPTSNNQMPTIPTIQRRSFYPRVSAGSQRLSWQTAVPLGNPKSPSILHLEVFLYEDFSLGKGFRIFLFELLLGKYLKEVLKNPFWAFPGGSLVRSSCFHFREPVFDPWSGNLRPQMSHRAAKK